MRMLFQSRHLIVLGLSAVALLTGCRSTPACSRPTQYTEAQAREMPPLRIPAGLEAPDTRGALRIPELTEPEAPLPPGVRCLEEPPRYSPNARLEPPPAENERKRRRRAQQEPAPAAPTQGTPAPGGEAGP